MILPTSILYFGIYLWILLYDSWAGLNFFKHWVMMIRILWHSAQINPVKSGLGKGHLWSWRLLFVLMSLPMFVIVEDIILFLLSWLIIHQCFFFVCLQNVSPNHRANDVIVKEGKPQVLLARFMYGPLDMITLHGKWFFIFLCYSPCFLLLQYSSSLSSRTVILTVP